MSSETLPATGAADGTANGAAVGTKHTTTAPRRVLFDQTGLSRAHTHSIITLIPPASLSWLSTQLPHIQAGLEGLPLWGVRLRVARVPSWMPSGPLVTSRPPSAFVRTKGGGTSSGDISGGGGGSAGVDGLPKTSQGASPRITAAEVALRRPPPLPRFLDWLLSLLASALLGVRPLPAGSPTSVSGRDRAGRGHRRGSGVHRHRAGQGLSSIRASAATRTPSKCHFKR